MHTYPAALAVGVSTSREVGVLTIKGLLLWVNTNNYEYWVLSTLFSCVLRHVSNGVVHFIVSQCGTQTL